MDFTASLFSDAYTKNKNFNKWCSLAFVQCIIQPSPSNTC